MHRHGYKGRKLRRQKDQRRALIKGLASNMVVNESITTTKQKAKELVPYLEKLITKAKKGDLHNRRQVISKMADVESANKLFDEIAPKLSARNSGYLRIKQSSNRRGDNAELAKVSFVDDLKIVVKPGTPNEVSPASGKQPKAAQKKAVKPKTAAPVKKPAKNAGKGL
jgi:large subunit ribosomal protein L17